MGKKLDSAIKGGLAAVPIALGYGAAGNPSGGLLAMGVGMGAGLLARAVKDAPSEADMQAGRHRVVNNRQKWPK